MPGWLLKEGADEEDESGSEYDPAEELPEPDEEAAEYEVDGVVRGRVRLHGSKQSTSGLQVDDERRNSLAERKYVRSVVKRGVGPSGGDNFEACPGREAYAAGEEGSAQWAEQILAYADDNFNDAGIEVRSMDYRDRKVGLFGDFLERVGHGKFVEWELDEEHGGLYALKMVMRVRAPLASSREQVSSARAAHAWQVVEGEDGGVCMVPMVPSWGMIFEYV